MHTYRGCNIFKACAGLASWADIHHDLFSTCGDQYYVTPLGI